MTQAINRNSHGSNLIRMAVGTVLSCILLSSCKEKPNAEKLNQLAIAASAVGDHSSAIIHYKTIEQLNPQNPIVRFQLGKEYLETAQPELAERELRRAFELGISFSEIQPWLLRALLEQHLYDKLIQESEADLKAGKLDAYALSYRGMALLAQAKVDAADEMFERALKLKPALPLARLGQARVSFARGQIDAAFATVKSILVEHPKMFEALAVRADMHLVLNQRAQAIAGYQQLIDIQPKNTSIYARLVTLLCEAKRFGEANHAIEELSKVSPSNGLVDYLNALVLFHKNDFVQARQKLITTQREMPNFIPGLVLAGRIELADNQAGEAIKYLNNAVHQAAGHVQARMLLANAYMQTHQPQQAFEVVRPILGTSTDPVALYELAGMALLQSNEPHLASQYFAYAHKLAPDQLRIRRGLELSRMASQWDKLEMNQALPSENKSLQFPRRVFEIVQVLMQNQPTQWAYAEKLAQRLVIDYPKQAIGHNLLGTIYAEQGRLKQARTAYEQALTIEPTYYPSLINLSQLDLNQGQREAAFARFEQLLAKQPNHLAGLLGRAEIGRRAGEKPEEIVRWLEQAQRAYPQILKPTLLIARHYFEKGNYKQALSATQQAQKIAPNDAEITEIMGRSMMALGNRAGALTAFSRLVGLRPGNVDALLWLARAQINDGKHASAVQTLQNIIQIQPTLLEARVELILLYARSGQKNEAAHELSLLQTLPLIKKNPFVVKEVEADMALANQQYSQAIVLYRDLFEHQPNPALLRKVHHALLEAGQIEQAYVFALPWLQQHPQELMSLLFLAVSADQQKRYKISIEFYEMALRVKPGDPQILNNLAVAMTNLDPKRAVTIAEQALQLTPEDPLLLDTLGWAFLKQDQVTIGIKYIDQASRKAPDNLTIGYHYAVALAKSGDYVGARLRVNEVLTTNRHFPEEIEAKNFRTQLSQH